MLGEYIVRIVFQQCGTTKENVRRDVVYLKSVEQNKNEIIEAEI